MIRKSTFLAALGIALLAMGCTMEPAEPASAPAEEVASTQQDISALCHIGQNGDDGYCTTSCQCGIGEGDCNSSTECGAGLKCLFNTGANYGFHHSVDVCDCPLDSDNGGGSFCSATCPCEEGQGDCDNNDECEPGLLCYRNVGLVYGMDEDDDVCASCLPSEANGTIDFCNPGCPCDEGQGDCDSASDCAPGLQCILNVGADFGLDPDTDVCAACRPDSQNGHVNFCTPDCPCSHGQGDCDSDAECETGLTCVNNIGALFGLDSGTDVCVNLNP